MLRVFCRHMVSCRIWQFCREFNISSTEFRYYRVRSLRTARSAGYEETGEDALQMT